eukprot:CAMPEP_0194335438 /NCGR_PEP_ID=MMETSP0171-20130528/69584_1 /TAXON_ID=218684 /ORGANISM="Corethron pennatum, Strain L29A3" /LENGTH=43 /DNA_ID= /DNA_START= /DNA_END= /DNA_ORIENTATION=
MRKLLLLDLETGRVYDGSDEDDEGVHQAVAGGCYLLLDVCGQG